MAEEEGDEEGRRKTALGNLEIYAEGGILQEHRNVQDIFIMFIQYFSENNSFESKRK